MAQQLTLNIPPGGSLGVCIQQNSGQCVVVSKNSNASALCVGDVILSMNGIVFASVDGGLHAWKKLFLAFVAVPRKLIVQRPLQQPASAHAPNNVAAEQVKSEPQPKPTGGISNHHPPLPAQPSAIKSNVNNLPSFAQQHIPLPSSGLPTLHPPQMQHHAPPPQPPTKPAPPTTTRDSIALMAMELAKSSKPSVANTAAYAKAQQLAHAQSSKPSGGTTASAAAYAKAQRQLSESSKQLAASLAKMQQKKHALKPSSHGNTTAASNKKAKKSNASGRKEWNHDDNYMKMMLDGFREFLAIHLSTCTLSSQLS